MDSKFIYQFFSKYIFEHTGINYTEQNFYQLESRLKNLKGQLGVETIEEVYAKYQGNVSQDLHLMLIDLATNNETFFFRDTKLFNSLFEEIIPSIINAPDFNGTVNIWSAACSSGQEPYSILMGLMERGFDFSKAKINILATDIDKSILAKAKSGEYGIIEVQRGLPILMLTKYFDQIDDQKWELKDAVKSKVTFSHFNLLNGHFPLNTYDIVLCRNVLIYQAKENRQKILEKIFDSLKLDGKLILGNGESLIGIPLDFKSCYHNDSLYYQKMSMVKEKSA